MKQLITLQDFKQYLAESFSLRTHELERLLDEINSFYELEMKDFIRLRHLQLKKEGLTNEDIYSQIQFELEERRFKAEFTSLRQIRRIIYG